MGVLALEGEAVQLVAVDAAIGIALDAQAAAPEVFGYWREGLFRPCTIPSTALRMSAAAAQQVAGRSLRREGEAVHEQGAAGAERPEDWLGMDA